MKKLFLFILFLLIFISQFAYPQFRESLLSPSGYYTYGNYSNGNYSNEYSIYTSVYQNRDNRITAGYDNLIINNKEWNYKQQTILIGGLKAIYPFYLKLNYAFVQGNFNYSPYPYNYTDKTNLANIHAIYNLGKTYLGFSYTYLNLKGIKNLTGNQLNFTFDWIVNSKLTLSIYPNYTIVTDGRNLSSVSARVSYLPVSWFKIITGGFLGKRAYYFNPSYLTLLNQNETQTGAYNIKAEFYFVKPIDIIAAYQYLQFQKYKIVYFTAGLKFNLGL